MPMCGVLCCAGKIDGTPCPKQLQIDLKTVSHTMLAERLPGLHMDHNHDVKRICDVWSHALPKEPQSWDDGICGPLLAHLLFGTEDHVLTQCSERPIWRKQIEVRCGNVRGVKEQHSEDFCHDVANTHYDHVLRMEDIAWPTESNAAEKEEHSESSGSTTEWEEWEQ